MVVHLRVVLGIFLCVTGAMSFFNLTFKQSDYKLKFEWGELLRYDPVRVKHIKMSVFKFNRTCTAGNLTVEYNVEVGYDLVVVIQVYKFASNEFRIFPIRFQVNFCEGLALNLIGGGRALTCGNFSGCPLRMGVRYHACNFVPDATQFPPYIPSGRYKMEATMLLHSHELWVGNGFGEIYRPLPEQE